MLTELKLKSIKFTDKVTLFKDGNSLFQRVSKTKKNWQLSFMVDGKQKHFYAPKGYPDMGLADARKWAYETRNLTTEKIIASTSDLALTRFIDLYEKMQIKMGRSQATLKKLDLRLNKYIRPHGDRDVRTFTPQDILKILRPIEERGKLEALKQVRQMINNIFLRAKIEGAITSNPCEGLDKVLVPANGKSRAAVTDIFEFGQLLRDIDKSTSFLYIKTALPT